MIRDKSKNIAAQSGLLGDRKELITHFVRRVPPCEHAVAHGQSPPDAGRLPLACRPTRIAGGNSVTRSPFEARFRSSKTNARLSTYENRCAQPNEIRASHG
jgi:hypothetical protein